MRATMLITPRSTDAAIDATTTHLKEMGATEVAVSQTKDIIRTVLSCGHAEKGQ